MGNLVSDRIGIDSDPELVRRQVLLDRERQFAAISNPQQQLAARLGGLLGGGLVNVAQDRGFFEVNDPLLNRVSQIQGIYNDVASRVDPAANPEAFFRELSSAYSEAGLGKEAIKAVQEAEKLKVTGMDTKLKELQLLERDVEGIPQRIQALQEKGDAASMVEAQRLANIYTRVIENRQLEKRVKEAGITRDLSAAEAAKANAESKDIIYLPDGLGGKIPVQRVGDKFVPVQVEGMNQQPAGQGKGKYSSGTRRGVYNPITGRVEYN